MYLDVNDIASYVFCPVLQAKKRHDIVIPNLTFVEENRRAALIEGERNACLKDSMVVPRKLLRSWEKIWWPAAAKAGISMKEADKVSLHAGAIFADYCKYDISGWMYPTVGVEAESDVRIGPVVLRAKADVVKVDLDKDKPTTVLVNFNTRKLTLRTAAWDPAIKATAYAFYSGRGETITHISVDIDERKDMVNLITSTFRPEGMEEIRKMLYYVGCGIRFGSHHANPYLCKECKVCQDFTL